MRVSIVMNLYQRAPLFFTKLMVRQLEAYGEEPQFRVNEAGALLDTRIRFKTSYRLRKLIGQEADEEFAIEGK